MLIVLLEWILHRRRSEAVGVLRGLSCLNGKIKSGDFVAMDEVPQVLITITDNKENNKTQQFVVMSMHFVM